MSAPLYQVNVQTGYGGGEVYTTFFSRALDGLGVPSVLFAHLAAGFWREHLPAATQLVPTTQGDLRARLASLAGATVLFHTPLPREAIDALHGAGGRAVAVVHMPWYDRDAAALQAYDLLVPVSGHVADSLRTRGLTRIHDEPLYGVADLRGRRGAPDAAIVATPVYAWDLRKLRERVLRRVYPLWWRLQPRRAYARRAGVTLGIVSRLTTIKQFPALFTTLAPVLRRYADVHLEIFGSGAYASVRDLRRALAPLGDRVRWWGHQRDVGTIYAQLDYLMAGLPEKEALGLNVIEAQACGLPVLAVNAPPFTETVAGGVSGLFYDDPRRDAGQSFERLLQRLQRTPFVVGAEATSAHLARFSEAAFAGRVARLLQKLELPLRSPA